MSSDGDAKSDAESDGGNVEVMEDEDDEEEPTEEEIKEYAEYLGIDLETEQHLMWIARQGVGAPVPKPWKACKDKDEVFYYNFETNESMWDHPSDAHFRSLVDKHRKAPNLENNGRGESDDDSASASVQAPNLQNNARGESDEDSASVSEEIKSELPSESQSAASTPANASGGQFKRLESGGSAADDSIDDDAAGADAAPADAAGGPIAPAGMGTSPTGAAADLDVANQSGSFLSECVDSEDMESPQSPQADGQARASPSGAPKTLSTTNDDTKSSFVSDLVDESDLKVVSEDSGLATSPTGARVAEETAGKQPEAATSDAEPSPAAVPPLSKKDQQKDLAAMWRAASGGTAQSTPRSPPSSRSRSSSPSPRGEEPVSAGSSVSAADARDGAAQAAEEPVSASSSVSAADARDGAAQAPVEKAVTSSEVQESPQGPGKLLLTFKEDADMNDIMKKVTALAMVTSTELLEGAAIGLVDVSDVSFAESAIQKVEGVASIEIDQEESIATSGKPVVEPISSEPLDARALRKSPQGSPSSGDRPPPVLDNVACGHSARSSNPSEVSEDFKSDWMSPPVTARSGSGVAKLGAEEHSLEVSMSMDERSEGAGRSAGTGSLSRSPPGARSPSLASAPIPRMSSRRTWAQLQRELQVLSKALESCELIRAKQRDYLFLLNIDSLKGS